MLNGPEISFTNVHTNTYIKGTAQYRQTDVKTLLSHSVYNNKRVLPAETRYRV